MPTLRLGTRKSALAQAQANWVADQLRQSQPDFAVELVLITTTGDQHKGELPAKGGLKAQFTKEIEEALLDKRIDLAVHSLKDMAAELPPGLTIGAVPLREDPRDAWISRTNLPFEMLPRGSKIGTGAVRRQAQLKHLRPDLEFVPIRGNVDTRLRKLQDSGLDGIILALAGLKRLGREREVTEILSTDLLLPAVGQGCLALEYRENDRDVVRATSPLDHPPSHQAALAERAFLKAMGGSCQTPLAAYATLSRGTLSMTGFVSDPFGKKTLRDTVQGTVDQAETLGQRLAEKLLGSGGKALLS